MIKRFALVLLAGLLLVPTTAFAATHAGKGSDAKGDAANPGLDIVKMSASYTSGGVLKARVTFAAPPTSSAIVAVLFSTGRCYGTPGGAMGFNVATSEATAFVAPRGRVTVPAKGSVKGNTVTLTARGRAFAGKRWTCANAAVGEDKQADIFNRTVKLRRR